MTANANIKNRLPYYKITATVFYIMLAKYLINKLNIMNIEEFNLTALVGHQRLEYDCKEYDIYSADFKEKLFAINYYNDKDELRWLRCENVKLILP